MPSKYNGKELRVLICTGLEIGIDEYENFIRKLYRDGLSGQEVSEFIERETGEFISPRSVQRIVKKHGETRSVSESFQNAMDRGRVVWQPEEDVARRTEARHQINRGLRMRILERDGFKCVLCGAGELLQVDHIVARRNGGSDEEENLRTLCIDCNIGKRIVEKESVKSGGFKSGVVA